ncbi:MAG TPA: hypothetical protein VF052_07270 [Solirubrobacterales bacterium]
MRAKTKKKHNMGRRFAILIGVAAAGVMALGAQTAAAATYNTKLTISQNRGDFFFGRVNASGGKKCEVGRLVTLFKQKPGADRKLGAVRSQSGGNWRIGGRQAKAGWRVYAKATPEVGDGFVCSGDRSPIWRAIG